MTKIKFMIMQIIAVLLIAGMVFADGPSEQDGISAPGVSEPIKAILPPDLSNYPDMFVKDGNFNAVIVVGDKAPASDAIAQSNLASFFVSHLGKSLIGYTKLSSEIGSLNRNIISIGSACHNNVSWMIMGYPTQCDRWLEPGKAIILLYGYKDYTYMVISGHSDKGTRDAVEFLINQKEGSLSGSNLLIDVNEPKPQINESNVNQKTTEKKEEDVSVNIEEEKEKIALELNKRIANKSEDSSKMTTSSIGSSTNKSKDNILTEQKQAIKTEQKEEVGIIKSIRDWFKKLFS